MGPDTSAGKPQAPFSESESRRKRNKLAAQRFRDRQKDQERQKDELISSLEDDSHELRNRIDSLYVGLFEADERVTRYLDCQRD